MTEQERAWNELATAQEYIQDCENQIGTPIDSAGQLENLANAEKHINRALLNIGLAVFKLQNGG